MGKGTGFGKTILIGDQFVLDEVPAIVSAISYETVTTVERTDGEGWVLEDNRIEVPGYKKKKAEQQVGSINRVLEVMNIDVKKEPDQDYRWGKLAGRKWRRCQCSQLCFAGTGVERGIQSGLFDRRDKSGSLAGRVSLSWGCERVDNTASTYGGLLRFWLKNGQQNFERIKTPKPFEIVLTNSGITANTAALDEFIDKQKIENPGLFWIPPQNDCIPGL